MTLLNLLGAEAIEVTPGGTTTRRAAHPLFAAIDRAPLEPVSDEENAMLDELERSTEWLTDEEFEAERSRS